MFEITAESLAGVEQKIKPKVLDDEDLKPLREDGVQWPYLAPSTFNSSPVFAEKVGDCFLFCLFGEI